MDRNEISPPNYLNIMYFKNLGFWPIETSNRILNKMHLVLGRAALVVFAIFVVSLFVNITLKEDMKLKTTLLPVALSYFIGLIKVSALVMSRDLIYDVMKQACLWENNILSGNVTHLKNLVQRHRKRAVIMIYSYTIQVMSLVSIFALQPYVQNNFMTAPDEPQRNGSAIEYMSIFDAWVPWDKTSTKNYNLTYVYELIMLVFGSMQHVSFDTTTLALLMYAITRVHVLKYKLSNMTGEHEVSLARIPENVQQQTSISKIIDAYTDFKSITRLIKTLDSVISGVMSSYFFAASVIICCTMYQVSLDDNSGAILVKMLSFTTVLLVQLYLPFWYGNQVTIEMDLLLNASYECQWYKEDIKFQKSFLLLRIGFLQEYAFSIAHFSKISLRTFLGILKTTYSVYTLLRQTQNAGVGRGSLPSK